MRVRSWRNLDTSGSSVTSGIILVTSVPRCPAQDQSARVANPVTLHHDAAMTTVYLLHHVHEGDQFDDDTKLIGVYSSEANAVAAKARLADQLGFRELPAGFRITAHILNTDYWREGFVTMTRVNMPLENEAEESWTMVVVQDLHDGRYRVRGPMPAGECWRYPPGSIVRCDTVIEDGAEYVMACSLA